MKKLALAFVAAAALAACGKKTAEPPKTAAAPAAAPADAHKEEHREAPGPESMPGMSDLFKGKDGK